MRGLGFGLVVDELLVVRVLGHITFGDVVHAGQGQKARMLFGGLFDHRSVADLGVQRTTLHGVRGERRQIRRPRDGPFAVIGLDGEHGGERENAVHVIEARLRNLGGFARREDFLVQCHWIFPFRYEKTRHEGRASKNRFRRGVRRW